MNNDLRLLVRYVWPKVDISQESWCRLSIEDKNYYFNGLKSLWKIKEMTNVSTNAFILSFLRCLKLAINKDHCPLVYFEMLNGYFLLNIESRQILKCVDGNLEPNFLKNYHAVNKLLTSNSPTIINSGTCGKFQYVVTEFICGAQKLNWETWRLHQEDIFVLMKKVYKNYGFKGIEGEDYFSAGFKRASTQIRKSRYLKYEYSRIISMLKKSLLLLKPKDVKLYTSFSHGDLVPNNVLLDKENKYYLLDWDNGGVQNCFYDLFMQDFYFPDRKIWKDLLKADFFAGTNTEYFNGASRSFINMLKSLRLDINNEQVRLSIMACLFEIAEKNFLRHQCVKWRNDGRIILKLVIVHLENILN